MVRGFCSGAVRAPISGNEAWACEVHRPIRLIDSWMPEIEISMGVTERSLFFMGAWAFAHHGSIAMIERCMFFMDCSMILMERWMNKTGRCVLRVEASVFWMDG